MDKNKSGSLIIDGIAASEAIDSSGEIADIGGMDISDLEEGHGILNYEHKNEKDSGSSANDNVGHIIFAKKIMKESDCSNDRQRKFWKLVELPFVYIQAELYNDEDHPGAKALAAQIRYYKKRNLPIVVRYSIEGSTLKKEGNRLKATVAKRVAATIKPCNRSCVSDVLFDGAAETMPELPKLDKSEQEISGYIAEYDCVLGDSGYDLFKHLDDLKEVQELTKALTAGNFNASPDSLRGGAALQREEISGEKYKTLVNQARAAYRDRDRTKNFRTFLKSKMPEVSDSYIDHFIGIIHAYELAKNELLSKDLYESLKKQENQLKPIPKPVGQMFRGKRITPGEGEVVSGIYKGNKLQLLGNDHAHYFFANPHDDGSGNHPSVVKMPRNQEGISFKINQRPFEHPDRLHVDATEHGSTHNKTFKQQSLIHGMDLLDTSLGKPEDEGQTAQVTSAPYGFFKSFDVPKVFVKPSADEELKNKDMPFAQREVVYHNLANDFWGLGQHVPTTAHFSHPDSGEEMSAMQYVQPTHKDSYRNEFTALHNSGDLDKISLMDMIMGNSDRHSLNYIVNDQYPHVHLIDNAGSLDYSRNPPSYYPGYWDEPGSGGALKAMHPEIANWILSKDPNQFVQHLTNHNVPPNVVKDAVKRLHGVQSMFRVNPTPKREDVLDSLGWK